MKRAAESDEPLLEGIARDLKRARVAPSPDDTLPEEEEEGEEYLPADMLVHEILERHAPQMPVQTIAAIISARPAFHRTPDGIQLANYLWFQTCLYVFPREWPDPGQPPYMPPLLAAMQWVNGGVPVTDVEEVSPKNPRSGYARAAADGASAEAVAWAVRRRVMWQSIYTACAAAVTLASAAFENGVYSFQQRFFGCAVDLTRPVLADDKADAILRAAGQQQNVTEVWGPHTGALYDHLGTNDAMRGRVRWYVTDKLNIEADRRQTRPMEAKGKLTWAVSPALTIKIIAGAAGQFVVLGSVAAAPGTSRALLTWPGDQVPCGEVEMSWSASPTATFPADTRVHFLTLKGIQITVTRFDAWRLARHVRSDRPHRLPYGIVPSAGMHQPDWRHMDSDRANFVRTMMHAFLVTTYRLDSKGYEPDVRLFALRYNWLMNGPQPIQPADDPRLDDWFLPPEDQDVRLPIRFQIAPRLHVPKKHAAGDDYDVDRNPPDDVLYRRTPGMFRAPPVQ